MLRPEFRSRTSTSIRRTFTAVLVAALTASTIVSAAAPAPVSIGGAHRVWYPEADPRVTAPIGHRYFRETFTVAAGAVSDAQLVVTGDDTVDVWSPASTRWQSVTGPSTAAR